MTALYDGTEDRVREIESDISIGVKRTPDDLTLYLSFVDDKFRTKKCWRHRESGGVYEYRGLGLAATGNGNLALMVHYTPLGRSGPMFERQYSFFKERFESVHAVTVWEPTE